MLLIPAFVLLVVYGYFGSALIVFTIAGVTDALDGLIARWTGQKTTLGAWLDPAADKLLLLAAFILLTRYPQLFQTIPMTNRIPLWLTTLAISRDVLIVAIALMLNLAYGQTRFSPSIWGKVTTGAELTTTGLVLYFNYAGRTHPIVALSIGVTLALILVSGFDYLWRTVVHVREKGPERGAP